jgi:UDP-N-acetylmuramate--alanine ligase
VVSATDHHSINRHTIGQPPVDGLIEDSVQSASPAGEAGAASTVENRIPPWQKRLQESPQSLRVHIMGIGGTGMGPIARVLLQMGVQVSGSDRQTGPSTAALAAQGARIFASQSAANLQAFSPADLPHLVLISSAVAPENPERQAAEQQGLPVVKRAAFLPALLAQRQTIAVAGTHGKTTTTGMIAHILQQNGLAPGYIIGADVPGLGISAAGQSPYFVIEADEYDRMFWGLHPHIAVVTNVEWDHPDCFPTEAEFFDAFRQFLSQVRADGHVISCYDDSGAEKLRRDWQNVPTNWITYGTQPQAQLRAYIADSSTDSSTDHIQVLAQENVQGKLELAVPGLHNVRNALAAIAAAQLCGVPYARALASLATFRGSSRRFEIIGTARDVTVIDDYGHHPTEVAATLAATRSRYPDRVIRAVFQPHTFSRTRLLLAEMASCFEDADHALITDIYPAREQDDGSVHARQIAETSAHPGLRYTGTLDATAQHLMQTVEPGDVVIVLSAGDATRIGRELLAHLARPSDDTRAHAPQKGATDT